MSTLGLDVSFDIFGLLSFALFGLAMLKHPHSGRVFGVTGLAISIATVALNLYAFPVPPSPDPGPLAGLWLGAVAIRMLMLPARADKSAASHEKEKLSPIAPSAS